MAELIERLRWKCRRGMLELDLFLLPYVNSLQEPVPAEELSMLNALLEMPDPVLFAWFIGQEFPDERFVPLVEKIQHAACRHS